MNYRKVIISKKPTTLKKAAVEAAIKEVDAKKSKAAKNKKRIKATSTKRKAEIKSKVFIVCNRNNRKKAIASSSKKQNTKSKHYE